MSRRIAVFALAAGTALMVGPVAADQECFDSTCMQPAAVEAPAEVVRTPVEASRVLDEIAHAPAEIVRAPAEVGHAAIDAIAAPDDVASAHAAAGNDMAKDRAKDSAKDLIKDLAKDLPGDLPNDTSKGLPQDLAKMPVVETPPPAVVARKVPPEQRIYPKSAPEPAPRRAAQSSPPRPAPPAPRYTDEQDIPVQEVQARDAPIGAPVRVVNPRARYRTEQPAVSVEASAQVPMRAPAYRRAGSPNVIVVAPPIAEDGTIAAYPALAPDPNWKLCQIEQRSGRYHYCTAYSYHPYGAGGYRPMGTYRAYGTAPGYVTTQPDARIISLDQDD